MLEICYFINKLAGWGHDVVLDILRLYSNLPQLVTKTKCGLDFHIANLINNVSVHVCNMWQVFLTYRYSITNISILNY